MLTSKTKQVKNTIFGALTAAAAAAGAGGGGGGDGRWVRRVQRQRTLVAD